MEVRLIPRRPSAASRQCPHLGDAGLWRACRPHPWSQWSARPILRQMPATYEHIFRKRLFSACHPLHSDTDIQWIAQRPSSPQFDRPYHYPSKAWSFGTLITGRVLRHFPPECRRQLPQSGLRSENVRLRNEGFIEIFKCLAVAASLIPGEGRRATGMPSSSKKHGAVRVPDSIEEAVQDVRTKPRHPAE